MKFDAIVIGSGQAGNPLSHKLADHGWTVALIEKEHLGGTCINTGCMPTKTMVASAQVAHYARNAARWGVRASGVSVDLPAIVARKDKIVESFRSGQQRNIDKRPNLHLYRGEARFTEAHRLVVGSDSDAVPYAPATSARCACASRGRCRSSNPLTISHSAKAT